MKNSSLANMSVVITACRDLCQKLLVTTYVHLELLSIQSWIVLYFQQVSAGETDSEMEVLLKCYRTAEVDNLLNRQPCG